MNKRVTIAILCYNKYELTNSLLSDLFEKESDSIDSVIVFDNASTDETQDGLLQWQSRFPKISVERPLSNLGFTLGANTVLKLATQNDSRDHAVFLVSNDVKIRGKFAQHATDILFSQQNYLVGHKLLSYDTGWNKFGDKIFPYLEGYFLAATAHGWRDLGYFDEMYAPHDYEDVDLSTKAKSKGYKLTPLNNPAITHLGGGTLGYNPEREAITRRNQEYFKRKWVR